MVPRWVIAMESKTLTKPLKKGFTIPELLLVITLMVLLVIIILGALNPKEMQSRARDTKRLSDLQKIERAVNEYETVNKTYPGSLGVLRSSNTLPSESTNLQLSADGWMGANLSPYLEVQPTDPLNDSSFHYSYKHDASGYELDAKLEYYTDKMTNDGGNDANLYEVGNNLSLIFP